MDFVTARAKHTSADRVSNQDVVVWMVEDNDLFRQSTRRLIDLTGGMSCPVAVGSCEEAFFELESADPPDIVLMDIGLPGMDGIEGARRMASLAPETRIIILTIHEENEKIFEAICAGASGYLLKPSSTEQIVDAILKVKQGAAPINAYIAGKLLEMFAKLAAPKQDYGLSARETEILKLLVQGMTMKQIARELDVSFHTIDTHVRNIYAKLHVHTRTGAVAKALQERLV